MKLIQVFCVIAAIIAVAQGGCKEKRGECVDLWTKDTASPKCRKGGTIFTHGRMDLGILLDVSKFVTPASLIKAKAYIKEVIDCFVFSADKARVSVISYAGNGGARVEFTLKQSETMGKANMMKKIDAISRRGGNKDTLAGLTALKQVFDSNPRHAKFTAGLYRAAFMLTDDKGRERVNVAAQNVELAFALDVTGTMSRAIDNAKSQIKNMIADLRKTFKNLKLKIGMVAYRDTTDKGKYPHFEIQPFTSDQNEFQKFLNKLRAWGGGDIPEDLLGALDIISKWQWRATTKMLVGITDAEHRGNFNDEKGKERLWAERLIYDFKCKKNLDHILLLRTISNREPLNQMNKVLDEISAQKCGATGFLPGNTKFFYDGPYVQNSMLVKIVMAKVKTSIQKRYMNMANILHRMGIDMHAAGLSAGADYAMLEEILGLAVRKETGSSNPVIRINKGQTFVVKKVRKLFKEMISKEIKMCDSNPCGKGHICKNVGASAFKCCCSAGWEGNNCKIQRCPKCRAEALVMQFQNPETFVPVCNAAGFFKPKQCHGGDCFCVDQDGNEVKRTRRKAQTQINCQKFATTPKFLSDCQTMHNAGKAGKREMTPSCDANGMFQTKQCSGGMCWCSQPNGKFIPNTFHKKGAKSAPNCQRHAAIKPVCGKKGGYQPHPFDCSRYIICSPGRIFSCSCPDGLYFNKKSSNCDRRENVQCVKSTQQKQQQGQQGQGQQGQGQQGKNVRAYGYR